MNASQWPTMPGATRWGPARQGPARQPERAPAQPELRIGDAEREQVTNALHEHFAQGRLSQDELDERLDATLAAKTAGDLQPITADLPDLARPNAASDTSSDQRRRGRNWRGWPLPFVLAGFPVGAFMLVLFLVVFSRAFFFLIPMLMFFWFVTVMGGFARHRSMHHGMDRHQQVGFWR